MFMCGDWVPYNFDSTRNCIKSRRFFHTQWRRLFGDVDPDSLPRWWYCHLNEMDPAHASCDAPEEDSTNKGGYLECSPPKAPLYDEHPLDEGLTDLRGRSGGGGEGHGVEDKKPSASASGRRSSAMRSSSRASQVASLEDGVGEDVEEDNEEEEEMEEAEEPSPESPRRTSRRATRYIFFQRQETVNQVGPIS